MATMNWFNFLVLFQTIILSIYNVSYINGSSIRYDQRQTGDYNVQIHLKNLELFAILDDGILNSEYDYDYSDLTEKPSTSSGYQPGVNLPLLNATTTKPAANINSGQVNSSLNSSNNSLSSINSSAMMITKQLLTSPESANASVEQETAPLKIRKCAPGYYRDNLGRCRRLRKPNTPFLQMAHSPGVIKSFQQPSEENRTMLYSDVARS